MARDSRELDARVGRGEWCARVRELQVWAVCDGKPTNSYEQVGMHPAPNSDP